MYRICSGDSLDARCFHGSPPEVSSECFAGEVPAGFSVSSATFIRLVTTSRSSAAAFTASMSSFTLFLEDSAIERLYRAALAASFTMSRFLLPRPAEPRATPLFWTERTTLRTPLRNPIAPSMSLSVLTAADAGMHAQLSKTLMLDSETAALNSSPREFP